MTAPRLIDRELERDRLRALLATGQPRLALLYGRRRVGKTFLLTHLWPPSQVFYFMAADTTEAQNRSALIREFAAWSRQPLEPADYPSWRSVFRLLLDHDVPEPLVFVLDEFQYFAETASDLTAVTSELNAAWEARRPPRPRLLVLSGSAIRTMEALDAAAAPLYGRVSWKHQVQPFDYWDAARMASFPSLRDRVRLYGVFGGLPRHLADVDPARPFVENVVDLMLAPGGPARTLAETTIVQEQGLRETARYAAILRAIADGATRLNAIAQHAGLTDDTGLRDKLARLTMLGLIEAHRNLGAGQTSAFRYRLADPALLFYYRYVAPRETALARQAPAAVWKRAIAPDFDTYMGHIFERVAEQAYYRLQPRLDLPLVQEWGRWEGIDRDRQPLELDLTATLTDGRVLTGGVKWNTKPLDVRWYTHHEQMLDRLRRSGVTWAHAASDPAAPVLFVAAGGFSPAFERAVRAVRPNVYLWTLDDLYM